MCARGGEATAVSPNTHHVATSAAAAVGFPEVSTLHTPSAGNLM